MMPDQRIVAVCVNRISMLEWAVNDYIHAQYREPHVIISQFGDRPEDDHVDEFTTPKAFRQFYKSVERFA